MSAEPRAIAPSTGAAALLQMAARRPAGEAVALVIPPPLTATADGSSYEARMAKRTARVRSLDDTVDELRGYGLKLAVARRAGVDVGRPDADLVVYVELLRPDGRSSSGVSLDERLPHPESGTP